MGAIDDALQSNSAFGSIFSRRYLPREPARKLTIVTCMDARLDLEAMLGVRLGDAQILRNAGGIVTEDVLRSLLISHHLMKTEECMIIGHTDCGLLGLDEAAFRARLQQATGQDAAVPAQFYRFSDLEANVREQVWKARTHPWIPERIAVRGFLYDVHTGLLTEVECPANMSIATGETTVMSPPRCEPVFPALNWMQGKKRQK